MSSISRSFNRSLNSCSLPLLFVAMSSLFMICSFVDLIYGPFCMCFYHWLFICQCFLQHRKIFFITFVSNCNGQVSQIAASLWAFERTIFEPLIKFPGGEQQVGSQN